MAGGKRHIGQDMKVVGTFDATDIITAINKDIRTRPVGSNTGGGDAYVRSVRLAPVGYLYITDTSGTVVGLIGPDGSPASWMVMTGGSSPAGGGADSWQVHLTTGECRIGPTGQFSSSADMLSFVGTAGEAASFRAYLVKSHTQFDFLVDGTPSYSAGGGTFAFTDAVQINGGLTVSALTTFTCSGAATFASTASFSGVVTLALRVLYTNITSPANLTASQNNWNPIGAGTVVPSIIRVSCNAGVALTGMIAGVAGQRVTMLNVGTSNNLTINHASGSSSSANQFFCPGSTSAVVRINGGTDMWYDGTSSKWRLIGL